MTFNRTALINAGILAITMLLVSLILVVGTDTGAEAPPEELAIGQPSPETFIANRSTDPIVDEDATEDEQQKARNSVSTKYRNDNEATLTVIREVNSFFTDLRDVAIDESLIPEEEETTTSTTVETTTSSTVAGETTSSTSSTTTTTTEPPTTTTTTLPRRSIEEQELMMGVRHPTLALAISSFVTLYNNDLDRIADGEDSVFPEVEKESLEIVNEELTRGIKPSDLTERQDLYLNPLTRPPIFVIGLPIEEQSMAREAIAQLVGFSLQANLRIDDEATIAERDAAAAAVEPVTITYRNGDTIVEEGQPITSIEFEAIAQLGLYEPEVIGGTSRVAMALFGILAVLLAAFFLWRIAPAQWSEPRHMALLGILLVLAALMSRLPAIIAVDNRALGYLLPAAAIGFLAAILFDPRTAVVLAIPMAGFTALSTGDLAFTVYAGIATVVPVAFVSRVSSRRQLRVAVLLSAITVAPVAAILEWVFGDGSIAMSAVWAFAGAVIAGLISLGLVSFLESAFGVTTALGLLDLLDRNHPALRLIEEQAPGTFNHSMLVGALAGRAARAIDADPLLAQAAAWYHDLGKVALPQYFVENQFGVSNPHDTLPPEESAQIIRSHVTEGLKLAKRYRLPGDVTDGIRMHHGTSLMRYFYHRALEIDPDVDPELFRHHGVKPRQKEMAIVMISDATEAAARAYAHNEDPTADGLKNVVEMVVTEKVDDGQLDESQLTFGDLTRIKAELVRALMGYYHARVPYPGFPGPQVVDGAVTPALPATNGAETGTSTVSEVDDDDDDDPSDEGDG
ncbi:MAG: HDIG domain-containing protein [Actinomycetota bacterium]|nr:HDIG domain-containing protein [Actinomycetota bacterium]